MKKVFVFGTGSTSYNICTQLHDVEILGFLDKEEARDELLRSITKIGADASRLSLEKIAHIPGFTIEKYKKLIESQVTIFSMNCFGGLISHTLGLRFYSPFINMYFHEDGYLRFLKNPRGYLQKELMMIDERFNQDLKINYPICQLGDVIIYMNHYPNFEEAKEKFNERGQRINWDNICVVMYTENEKILREFDCLPYSKKICFTTLTTDLKSAYYLDPSMDSQYGLQPLWWKVNRYAEGMCWYYDIFDLLNDGKKTPLIQS